MPSNFTHNLTKFLEQLWKLGVIFPTVFIVIAIVKFIKHLPCGRHRAVAESLLRSRRKALLKLLPEVMWKIEHLGDELAYLLNETSKPSVEGVAGFSLLFIECERRKIN